MPGADIKGRMKNWAKRFLFMTLALVLATAVWLPLVHFFFKPNLKEYFHTTAISPKAMALARQHLALWSDPTLRAREVGRMRQSNAEWDFMGRTFLVMALANMSLREPAMKQECLNVIDTIVDETLRLEREHGIFYFLMNYAQDSAFVNKPARSLFEDGEIALMLGARCMVERKPEYRKELDARVKIIQECMNKGPLLCAESYPDECWMFCNAAALAAVKISDAVSSTDHTAFFDKWLKIAKANLVAKDSGILVSAFSLKGSVSDGPEGSSIWFVAHCLALLDEPFARDQYLRAKKELYRTLCGFGYAREWPESFHGSPDIDSGPIVPFLQASAGSSGQTFMAASQFGDEEVLSTMIASLNLAGFPSERGGRLRFCASNQVGDAVLLYSMVQGPLWRAVKERTKR